MSWDDSAAEYDKYDSWRDRNYRDCLERTSMMTDPDTKRRAWIACINGSEHRLAVNDFDKCMELNSEKGYRRRNVPTMCEWSTYNPKYVPETAKYGERRP